MSFHESDFPGLLKTVNNFNKKFNNPFLSDKLIKETYKYYELIPIYPGLIENTIVNMIKENPDNELKTGDWITFSKENKKYAGRISEITKSHIEFDSVMEIQKKENVKIEKSELSDVIKINEKQLEEDWPMLIFDKVE